MLHRLQPPVDYFCKESLQADLKEKTVRGGLVTGLAQAIRIGISMAAIPLLARLLDPADFGLVAMVSFFTGFAAMFVDAGLSMATVQRDEISHAQVSNLFWMASLFGLTIAIAMAFLAPAIGWFYAEPKLVNITLALAVSFVLSGLTVQHQALLRRGMQYQRLAVVVIVSQLAGLAVGISWAWTHRGQANDYWALVLMPLTVAMSRLVVTWLACAWRPGWPQRGVGTRQMVEFGANLTGSNFVNYFARNADNLLIGWWWGPNALGLYAQAYKLLLWPLRQILTPISAVATPALSRLQNDPAGYRRFFRTGVMLSSAVLVPIVFASLTLADDLILVLLSPKWVESTPIFLALGPAAFMAITAPATHWVYLSWGHTRQLLKMTLINSTCVLLGFIVALPYGPFWVAASFSLATCLIRLPNISIAFRPTPLTLRDLFAPMKAPVIAGVLAAAATLPTKTLWQDHPFRLFISLLAYTLFYLAGLAMLPSGRRLLSQLFTITKFKLTRTSKFAI